MNKTITTATTTTTTATTTTDRLTARMFAGLTAAHDAARLITAEDVGKNTCKRWIATTTAAHEALYALWCIQHATFGRGRAEERPEFAAAEKLAAVALKSCMEFFPASVPAIGGGENKPRIFRRDILFAAGLTARIGRGHTTPAAAAAETLSGAKTALKKSENVYRDIIALGGEDTPTATMAAAEIERRREMLDTAAAAYAAACAGGGAFNQFSPVSPAAFRRGLETLLYDMYSNAAAMTTAEFKKSQKRLKNARQNAANDVASTPAAKALAEVVAATREAEKSAKKIDTKVSYLLQCWANTPTDIAD